MWCLSYLGEVRYVTKVKQTNDKKNKLPREGDETQFSPFFQSPNEAGRFKVHEYMSKGRLADKKELVATLLLMLPSAVFRPLLYRPLKVMLEQSLFFPSCFALLHFNFKNCKRYRNTGAHRSRKTVKPRNENEGKQMVKKDVILLTSLWFAFSFLFLVVCLCFVEWLLG